MIHFYRMLIIQINLISPVKVPIGLFLFPAVHIFKNAFSSLAFAKDTSTMVITADFFGVLS